MSNLTLLLRFLRFDSCNAAICIQMYDLLMSRRGTDCQADRATERQTDEWSNTPHQAFHNATEQETPKQGHKLYYRASCIWFRSQSWV